MPFQSMLTPKIVDNIINYGKCGLPTLDENFTSNKILLKSLFIALFKMLVAISFKCKPFVTNRAREGFVPSVHTAVTCQRTTAGETFLAHIA